MSSMTVRFWGVRGSLPTPGPSTVKIGGNTPCVAIDAGDQILVLDAGTGIRELGNALLGTEHEITLAVSHPHWDHLMGLPLFAPLYEAGRRINVVQCDVGGQVHSPLDVLDGVHFPKRVEDLPADIHIIDANDDRFFSDRGFDVGRIALNHPGGCIGYRVTVGRRSFVYMTDNELDGPLDDATPFDALTAFAAGADLLCHDAQYIAGEMQHRWGWGHSTTVRSCDLAIAARASHLILFHHDPDRRDDAVLAIQTRARAVLAPHGIECTAAYEGLAFTLE